MFKDAKVGDRVFCYLNQYWGTIIRITPDFTYSIRVKFDNDKIDECTYTVKGKWHKEHATPVLFWDEVKPVKTPDKPVVYPKAGALIWVSQESPDCSKLASLRYATGNHNKLFSSRDDYVEAYTRLGHTLYYRYWKLSDIKTEV